MFVLKKTELFDKWLNELRLKNRLLSQRVTQRLKRMSMGNLGDVKPVGGKISEARIFSTPALRIYFMMLDKVVIVLLCGGTKSSQQNDIEKAKTLAEQILKEIDNEIN